MKILIRILVLLLVLAGIAYGYALTLPANTTHIRTINLKQKPDAIFALLSDIPNMPSWNHNLIKVEMLPPVDGKEASRQTFQGNMIMTILTSESTRPSRLVRTMGNGPGEPFAGSWTYDLTPTADGSELVLTEKSEVKNPVWRLMMQVFGPTKYIDQHLQDLAQHFGETATIH